MKGILLFCGLRSFTGSERSRSLGEKGYWPRIQWIGPEQPLPLPFLTKLLGHGSRLVPVGGNQLQSMIAGSDGRVASVDLFGYHLDSDCHFSQMDGPGGQSNKDLSRRRLVDCFGLLIEVSGVNHPNFIGPGRISWRTANFGLVKKGRGHCKELFFAFRRCANEVSA